MIAFGETLTNTLRGHAVVCAEFFWESAHFYNEQTQEKFETLMRNELRYELATELTTLYMFEAQLRSGVLPYDTEGMLEGCGWPGGSSGRDGLFDTFFGDQFDHLHDNEHGTDTLLIEWASGTPPFQGKYNNKTHTADGLLFGPAILKKFDLVNGHEYTQQLAQLWDVSEVAARQQIVSWRQ